MKNLLISIISFLYLYFEKEPSETNIESLFDSKLAKEMKTLTYY